MSFSKVLTLKRGRLLHCVALAALSIFIPLTISVRASTATQSKLFSGQPVSVWDLFTNLADASLKAGSAVEVPSPNGQEKLVFPSGWAKDQGDAYTIFAMVRRQRSPIRLEGYVQPHVIWANDSSGAFVFFSNGGANCCWETRLVSFYEGHITVTDPTRQVAQDFIAYRDKLGIKCELHHEYPNLYPIWLDREHALIAAETVHHSVCDCYGSFRAYEIDLPSGKVVKAFNQGLAKKLFDGALPWDLSAAPNDDWDVRPGSCALKR